MKPVIKFSKPWNNKMCCDFFTTIRPHDAAKYAVGNQFDSIVIVNGEETKPMPVKVERVYPMRLADIHESIFILDMAMLKNEAIKKIKEAYPRVDFDTTLVDVVVLGYDFQL